MKYRVWYNKGGAVPVLPNHPCAESDGDVLPVRVYPIREGHSGGGSSQNCMV
jgi:hypothetical protein